MTERTIATLHAPETAPDILLAEDDPVARIVLSRQLKKAGYRVEAVQDGAEALEKLKKRFYPILVTDWEMPGMDGVALCKAIRAMELDGYVYTLLLTARDSKEHIIAGLDAGADDYLTKPVDEAELVARLNTGRRILALEQSLRAVNEENRWLSITDALTGTFNRRYLMEQLPRELERSRRYQRSLSIALCDIDDFKKINDTYGHGIGDEVLQSFSERIRRFTRSTTDWMARYGGEEFIIVLPETPHQGGMQAAEKIRIALAATTFLTTAGALRVTASFGVSSICSLAAEERITVDALIRRADECLYESKRNGRNQINGAQLMAESNPTVKSAGAA